MRYSEKSAFYCGHLLCSDGAEFIEVKGEARYAGRRCRCGRATPDEARRQQSAKTAAWTDIASAIRTNLG